MVYLLVFPTCVGVNRVRVVSVVVVDSLPHVRGGEPQPGRLTNWLLESSPRAWG